MPGGLIKRLPQLDRLVQVGVDFVQDQQELAAGENWVLGSL